MTETTWRRSGPNAMRRLRAKWCLQS